MEEQSLSLIMGILYRLHKADDMKGEVSRIYSDIHEGVKLRREGKTVPLTTSEARQGIFIGNAITPIKKVKTPWWAIWR